MTKKKKPISQETKEAFADAFVKVTDEIEQQAAGEFIQEAAAVVGKKMLKLMQAGSHNYEILKHDRAAELQEMVNRYIDSGYEPAGGVSFSTKLCVWIQAVYLPERNRGN